MVNGPPNPGQQHDFAREPSGRCKVMVYDTVKNEFIQEFPRPKASCMTFSPRASLLVTWEPYTVDKETQAGVANLHIYNVASGQCVKSLIQKKVTYWSPSFSDDEKICCRNVNNELHFFENGNFDEIKTKLHLQKVAGYSLSGAGPPYMVAGYVPGAKGQPSFVRVFKYPNFGGNNAAIANRTFFKADKVRAASFTWGRMDRCTMWNGALKALNSVLCMDKKLICQATSPDTTSFQWCADGEHVLTATCAPRLRVGNGFRIWHYSGAMLHEELTGKGEELWEGFWCPAPTGRFPEKPISYRQVQSEVAAPAPPHPNKPMSKNKKKKEAKKNRDADKGGANEQAPAPMATAAPSNPAAPSTGDPEKDKKIRNLRKKLQQVEKLKEQQAAGKTLEKNQLEKLKTEDSLLEEIEALEIS
ncbi:EIF2A-like protein [Mya arenaria]|uniref:Eukaryotic translation initiation factor 2A n=1 Tax=Mya arenaria TaxID=6604 RepID=A0ABY7G1P8_MYAAR|nr:EIF2A-like protein [Mya arenaria]